MTILVKKNFLVDPVTTDYTGMVSVSQLTAHMSCPKKWEYGYKEGLTPRVDRPFLTIGRLCHVGMQYAMLHKHFNDAGPDYTIEQSLRCGLTYMEDEYTEYMENNCFLAEEIPTLEEMYRGAVSVFGQAWQAFNPDRWEVICVSTKKGGEEIPALELHFVIPCSGSKGLHGYIDAILRDRETADVWCVDYKFRSFFEDETEEAYNIQNAVYTRACFKLGIPITGTLTWQHSNTPPSFPSVNKNGTISRAKIKTTWQVYSDFCKQMGVDPAEYEEEMVPKLSEIEWCRCTTEYRNKPTTDRIWNDVIVPEAYAVKASYKKPNYRRMYAWNCKLCQFRDLCQAELRGYDADYIRTSGYVLKGTRDKNILDTGKTEWYNCGIRREQLV